jgi:hypothetical protein
VTIQDLGSIGELVAAVATVITLVYLARQIGANTTALRMEARRTEAQSGDIYISAIIESPEVARMFNEGLADPTSLSPEDVTRFSFLLGSFVGAEGAAFDEVNIGFAPTQTLDRRKQTLRRILRSPGGRWFWAQFAGDFHTEFRAYIDESIFDAAPAA